MDNNEIPKRVMEYKPEGRRSVGRPKLRWLDGVIEDLRKLGGWWTVARNRVHGEKSLRRPRPERGCSAYDDDDSNLKDYKKKM